MVATATRSSAEVKITVRRLLKRSACSTFPKSPDDPSLSMEADMITEEVKETRAIAFGMRGSRVRSNLVPPKRMGTRRLVRGSLILASPKFGIRIMASRPASIIISGSTRS